MSTAFLRMFLYGDDEEVPPVMVVASGKEPHNPKYTRSLFAAGPTQSIFFGPALRKAPGGTEKKDVHGTTALWVDVDNPELPKTTFPPTAVVKSGHGWHLYWRLAQPLTNVGEIERLNQVLIADIPTADDSCWNANRYMRFPGTSNIKNEAEPVSVELVSLNMEIVYEAQDFDVLATLEPKIAKRIRTGDGRGLRTRSERDWSVVVELVNRGAEDRLIRLLFAHQPIGDKHRDPSTPSSYLEHTIAKARESKVEGLPKAEPKAPQQQTLKPAAKVGEAIAERSDGYYLVSTRGVKRISTFTIDPVVLLDGEPFGAEDAIVGDVTANGYTWKGVTFPRMAFTSVSKLDRACPAAAWQWLGIDGDVRLLLPYLLQQLRDKGLPRVAASPTLGLHIIKGVPYFLGDKQVLSVDSIWNGFDGPLAWLPTGREHPELELTPEVDEDGIRLLRELLPQLNDPDVIWPMVGWYAASLIKPWLEANNYRFPILNVTGTRGSGKTSLIQRIFLPLFGQREPKSFDAGTTRFVTLALLGSANAAPVAFSEFRYDSVEKFIRYILLSYDTGHDPRGRADQTTVDYPLSAPYSIDGEDLIADPAAQERVVVASLHPQTVAEGSRAHLAFKRLRGHLPKGFAGTYIQYCLRSIVDGSMEAHLRAAEAAVLEAFPNRLPDRVRNNHVVVMTGIRLLCAVAQMEVPSAIVLGTSIRSIVNLDNGRSRTICDDFAEWVVNEVANRRAQFQYRYDDKQQVLMFQLAPAHDGWMRARRMTGRGALERDAIRAQLKETNYIIPMKVFDGVPMYGIDLRKAQSVHLDVPSVLQLKTMVIEL